MCCSRSSARNRWTAKFCGEFGDGGIFGVVKWFYPSLNLQEPTAAVSGLFCSTRVLTELAELVAAPRARLGAADKLQGAQTCPVCLLIYKTRRVT